jgi:hypothetical protein
VRSRCWRRSSKPAARAWSAKPARRSSRHGGLGGTFGTYLSDLRRNGLITERDKRCIANDILFPKAENYGQRFKAVPVRNRAT